MRLEALKRRLESAGERGLARSASRLSLMEARLAGLDPLAPLARGYAMARKADGTFLRRADEVRPGDALDIVVPGGTVKTKVTGVERNGE